VFCLRATSTQDAQSSPLHLPYQRVSLYQTTKIENLEGVHQVSASQRAKEIPH
jgi:hypothetical protein